MIGFRPAVVYVRTGELGAFSFFFFLHHLHNLNNYSGGEFHKLCLLKYEIGAIASIQQVYSHMLFLFRAFENALLEEST